MSFKYRLSTILLYVACVALGAHVALAYTSPGHTQGYVSDFAGILSTTGRDTLTVTLGQFEKATGSQIAVVTVADLGGDSIENYSNELFREWGIGSKAHNNGVLLLISRDDHALRIEVGYGLEGVLTDATSNSIIRNDLTPAFKQNKYDEGVILAVNDIIAVTKGEYTAPTDTQTDGSRGTDYQGIIFFAFFVLIWMASILGRSKSWWAGGVIGGVVGIGLGWHLAAFMGSILGAVIFGLLGLLFDYIVSKTYSRSRIHGTPIPWWIGGGRGGGSGFGGSGGGFGGFGGGSSGGGGASGRW